MTHTFGRRAATLSLSVLISASVLTACGGDEDTSSASGDASAEAETPDAAPEVTDEEFAAEANQVCADAYPAINAAVYDVDPADPTTVTDYFLPLVQDLQDQLAALTPSEGLAEGFGDAMDLQQAQLDAIIADPEALFSMDSSETNAAFDAIGLDTCGTASADIEPAAS